MTSSDANSSFPTLMSSLLQATSPEQSDNLKTAKVSSGTKRTEGSDTEENQICDVDRRSERRDTGPDVKNLPSRTETCIASQQSLTSSKLSSLRTKTSQMSNSLTMSTMRSTKFSLQGVVPSRIQADIVQRYEIEKCAFGAGAFGKVYIGRDKQMKDRVVAIKRMIVRDTPRLDAFLKEASIMLTLDHPHICKLYETYEQKDIMYLVMEYLEGRDLFERLLVLDHLDEVHSSDIVKQCACALKYAHARGIAHRDMKPDNVVFCSEDETDTNVKVIDWGLGFFFGEGTMQSTVGTPSFSAPEVLQGSKPGYSPSCDLYSLGVMTYFLLSGNLPFKGTQAEQLRMMKKEKYSFNESIWRQISPEARDFIKGLLKPCPRKRMSIDAVLEHPWLRIIAESADVKTVSKVLENLNQFTSSSQLISMCISSVVRQLDHRSLRDVHKVFRDLDTNGDGVLEFREVLAAFEQTYGQDSDEFRNIRKTFSKVDLDGSGTIDYTEFCAAGISEQKSLDEKTLWSAFQAFDVRQSGRITKDDVIELFKRCDMLRALTEEVCAEAAQEIIEIFDKNGDDCLDYEEFLDLVQTFAARQKEADLRPDLEALPRRGISYRSIAAAKRSVMKVTGLVSKRSSSSWRCCGHGDVSEPQPRSI